MRIGIFGGTFDPPHIGHIIIPYWVACEFALDKVIFMPAYIPPQKIDRKISPAGIRGEMVRMSICEESKFELSLIEYERGSISYTVESLEVVKRDFNKDELFLLIGADSFAQIESWFCWERIWDYATPIVFRREGFDIAQDLKRINRKILVSTAPVISLSSTMIRERVSSGYPIKYLVHPRVETFIIEKGLYK